MNMNTDTLNNLSVDHNGHLPCRWCVNSNQVAYSLDDFSQNNAKNNSGLNFLTGDMHSTADALIDDSIISTCKYLNFIEFKAGAIEFQNIRRKALESLLVYCYWKNLETFDDISSKRRFILVTGNSVQNNTVRARNMINRLKQNLVINRLYDGGIEYCSGKQFDSNFNKFVK